jgi:hypothetical protein
MANKETVRARYFALTLAALAVATPACAYEGEVAALRRIIASQDRVIASGDALITTQDAIIASRGCAIAPKSARDRPTALCRDNSKSFSRHYSGTCSGHGGVGLWLK